MIVSVLPSWMKPPRVPGPVRRSAEEGQMRAALIPWGRARWPGARVMEELNIGGCRADLAFVQEAHIAVVEIKSPFDTLDRLERQIRDFTDHVPEVWVAMAPKWIGALNDYGQGAKHRLPYGIGQLSVVGDLVNETVRDHLHAARVNHLLTVPMLHLAHLVELRNIASHHALEFRERWPRKEMMRLLSRKLTGDQIIAGVCRELRARPRGWAGDDPIPVGA